MSFINSQLTTSGITAYCFIRNENNYIWNGSNVETYNVANWSKYAVAMSEQTGSGFYSTKKPDSILSGSFVVYIQAGSSPASTDQAVDRGSIPALANVATGEPIGMY